MPARERSSWPEIPDDPDDHSARVPLRSPKSPPRPRAISELDRVLPWLGTLGCMDRRIVWARAAGLSWPRLAREFGISVGQVRYRWCNAIDHIVAAAVSLPFILFTFIAAWTNQFDKHRKLARWVFPLWLYVAVTGPVCYWMLKPYY